MEVSRSPGTERGNSRQEKGQPLGMEVGLGSGHIVLDGDPAPFTERGTAVPIFAPRLLWPNGWMDRDATWYKGRPRPRQHCVKCDPNSPRKGAQHPHHFSELCSGTVAHLSNSCTAGLRIMADRQTDRQTDRETTLLRL